MCIVSHTDSRVLSCRLDNDVHVEMILKLISASCVQRSTKGRLNPLAMLDPGIVNPGAVEPAAVNP